MTRAEIIKGLDWHSAYVERWQASLMARIERVVALAEAREREACAQVCDGIAAQYKDGRGGHVAERSAAAIRARGQA